MTARFHFMKLINHNHTFSRSNALKIKMKIKSRQIYLYPPNCDRFRILQRFAQAALHFNPHCTKANSFPIPNSPYQHFAPTYFGKN